MAERTDAVEIFPWILARIAMLPLDRVIALRPPKSTALTKALLFSSRERKDATEVCDEIAEHVPAAGAEDRSTLLELRRALHSGRPPRLDAARLERGLGLLPAELHRLVEERLHAGTTTSRLEMEVRTTLAVEMESFVRPQLRALAGASPFSQAIAHANPALWRSLRRLPPPDGMRPTREELGAWAFAVRAAAKTSPFGQFMDAAAVRLPSRSVTARVLSAVSSDRRVIAYPTRALLASILRSAVAAAGSRVAVPCVRNATMTPAGSGRVRMESMRYVTINGQLWRGREPSIFRTTPEVERSIWSLPDSFPSTAALAAFEREGMHRDEACRAFERMVAEGAILPEPVTDAYDDDPAASCARWLRMLEDPGLSTTVDLIEHGTRLAARLPAQDADERAVSLSAIEERTAPGETNETRLILVHEESYLDRVDGALPPAVGTALQALGDELRSRLSVRAGWLILRRWFRELYGPGGRCTEVVPFLQRAHAELARVAWTQTDNPVALTTADLDDPPGADAPAGVTVLFQVAAARSGKPWLVVNRLYDDVGWLSARWIEGLSTVSPTIGAEFAQFLEGAAGPREAVAMPVCGECNDLQRHPRVTRRTLVWPGEPLRDDEARIDARDLVIVDDPASSRLELEAPGGQRLFPLYLGGVIATPAWGPRSLLLMIARPFALTPMPSPEEWPKGDEVRAIDRVCVGDLVLQRARWRLPSATLLDVRRLDRPGRVVALARLFDRHGIDELTFARGLIRGRPMAMDFAVDLRKPTWVDVRNPLSVELLLRMAARSEYVDLEEMLPSMDDLCVEVDGRPHVSEFQTEMLIRR